MPQFKINISDEMNHVIGRVKSTHGLSNTSEAIEKIVLDYWEKRKDFI